MKKLVLLVLAVMVVTCMVAGSARADDQGNSFTHFMRGLFHWPFNAAKDSAQVVGDTGVKAVGTVADTGKAVGGTVTGEEGAAEKVVTTPVTGTADTVQTGVVGTAEMPGKSVNESWPTEKK